MRGYNLTLRQKDLLRTLVGFMRQGKLRDRFLVISWQDPKSFNAFISSIDLGDGESFEFDSESDLEALCRQDPPLVFYEWNTKHTSKLYSIMQAGFEAVDSDFSMGTDRSQTEATAGDVYNLSGDFGGAIVNINATLGHVSQAVNMMPNAEQSVKDELQQLIGQLKEALAHVPAGKEEEAEAVAETAQDLVQSATKEKPNKTKLRISAEGLKKAEETLATVMPAVLTIATQIVQVIGKYTGMGAVP
jgi:hypothetical protein